jgi:hypothetical protein
MSISEARPDRLESSSRVFRTPPRHSTYKPFGAIVITRPQFLSMQDHSFRVYTLNPEVVASYAKGSAVEKMWLTFTEPPPKDSRVREDIRVINNVNELRVRSTNPNGSFNKPKGTSENWWIESESGNEFYISSDMWTRIP